MWWSLPYIAHRVWWGLPYIAHRVWWSFPNIAHRVWWRLVVGKWWVSGCHKCIYIVKCTLLQLTSPIYKTLKIRLHIASNTNPWTWHVNRVTCYHIRNIGRGDGGLKTKWIFMQIRLLQWLAKFTPQTPFHQAQCLCTWMTENSWFSSGKIDLQVKIMAKEIASLSHFFQIEICKENLFLY